MNRFFFLFWVPYFLFAAPVGNPSLPAILEEGFFIPDTFWSNIQAGFTGDCLMQKKMKISDDSQIRGIRKARIWGNAQMGDVCWTIKERFEVSASCGNGRIFWSWNLLGLRFSGASDSGFFWGGSAKAIFFEIKDTSFSAFGQVGGVNGWEGCFRVNGTPASENNRLHLRYWQAGGAVSQKIGFFSPYAGALANQTYLKISRLPGGAARLQPQMIAGPILGCTLSNGSSFSLNLEWRGLFEEAFSVWGQIRF